MAGGSGSTGTVADDFRILPGEKVWRLIENTWYQANAAGIAEVQEAAFIGEVSLLRSGKITITEIDQVKNGKFAKYGIAELEIDDIRALAKCFVRLTVEPEWPADAHLIIIRTSGGKNLRATHPEVLKLKQLANGKALIRLPTP